MYWTLSEQGRFLNPQWDPQGDPQEEVSAGGGPSIMTAKVPWMRPNSPNICPGQRSNM